MGYSPRLGRFIQPDTIVPGAGNPQNFNRFSYVGNNPIMFVDPSGHEHTRGEMGCSGPMAGKCKVHKGRIDSQLDKPGGGDCGITGNGSFGIQCTEDDIKSASLSERGAWFDWMRNEMTQDVRTDAGDWFLNISTVVVGFDVTGQDSNAGL